MSRNVEFPSKLRRLFSPGRHKVAHGGRGSAKSWSVARALLIRAGQVKTRMLCTREIQKTIRDSVHRLLKDQVEAMNLPGFTVLDNEIRHLNGSLFIFAGLSDQTAESIKSFEGIDIVWCEEAQSISKRSWDVLLPTIRKPGSEIWITLNPDLETDETWQRFVVNPPAGAVVIQMNWRDNPWFPPELEAERLATLARDPDNYENIWEGVPIRVAAGAIYAKEVDAMYNGGRVRSVPHDPVLCVDRVWDLGWNDCMSIGMFQRRASEIRVIGYLEDSHKTLDWYVREMEGYPYRWGTDFLPHDGASRDFKTGKSSEEILQALGCTVEVIERTSVEEGIRAARLMFPRVYIDVGSAEDQKKLKSGTPRLLECLKRYRRRVHQQTNEPMAPLHDEYSHGADMWRGAAQCVERMGRQLVPRAMNMNRQARDWRA